MFLPLYVEQRDVVAAETLINEFGKEAGLEAADRADPAAISAIIFNFAAGDRLND